ncbi:MAG: carbohydrate-binding domain-containing protein, partial [Erysipelotrichia bacterium]|nr:carbohydrate-binding domain-containing protein [Erysipelotrichia bacterium]
MSYKKLIPLSVITILAVLGCQSANGSGASSSSAVFSNYSSVDISTPSAIEEPVNVGPFGLTTLNGNYFIEGNTYTITKGGLYVLKGYLNGQIIVAAGDNDNVELSLEGATIENDADSPIQALHANKVKIQAKAGTENLIKETRPMRYQKNNAVGEGAINSKVDLEIKGRGLLVVQATYNSGIHTVDDLEIQNATIHVTAPFNALRGNDSITIKSGTLVLNSLYGEGIRTKNTHISSKGNQRGPLVINGGSVYVDSLYTALSSSYTIIVDEIDRNNPTTLNIKTGKKSSHYNFMAYDETVLAGGLIATNFINIRKGTIAIDSDDYGIYTSYGKAFDNGERGLGNVNIEGGNISISADDDGLRADHTLIISGGNMSITSGTEGIEANHIKISGGTIHVFGTDDGINASRKINEYPTMEVTGGFINVTVASGDTDGIDSNGSFRQTGGVIISRGSAGTPSSISTAIEVDGSYTMTGGTFIAFNGMESIPTANANVLSASITAASSTLRFSKGNYSLLSESLNVNFSNEFAYNSFIIYSSSLVNNGTYTLKMDGTEVL